MMTRLTMTAIVILIVGSAVLATTGVLSFRNTKDKTGITIDKKELKEKTQEAVKKTEAAGNTILDKTGEAMRKAGDEMRRSSHEQKAPATTPPAGDKENDNLRQPDGSNGPLHHLRRTAFRQVAVSEWARGCSPKYLLD